MPIYLQHGNLIDYVPPTDTSTEDVVFMGGLVGIPQTFIPAGELGALSVDGVYMFTKKDGVSVNLGEVVKYCGTTKLAQDSNADLTLGVAVAKAEADSIGVKVKINSVLPTDGGGGGGGGGEIAVCNASGLFVDDNGMIGIKFCGSSAINADESGVYMKADINSGLAFDEQGYLFVNVAYGCGLDFDGDGALFATGGGGGSEVVIDTTRGLSENSSGIGLNIGSGLSFGESGELNATGGGGGDIEISPYGGLEFGCGGLSVKIGDGLEFGVCSHINVKIGSGLSFGSNGELTAIDSEVPLCGESGLYYDGNRVAIKYCGNSAITATINDGVFLKVCTASGLSIDENGYLTYNG